MKDLELEQAERLLSNEEKDEIAYYKWAIKHHMQLIAIWQERLKKYENE